MDACSIAVVGATGAVGRVFLDVLEERNFPVSDIRLCASERSVGKKLKCLGQEISVEMATPQLFSEVDFVFISASGDVSRALAPVAAKHGAVVIDDSSAFRMNPEVPLIVPEVNGADVENHKGIISIPNCSTTPLVMVLKPLMEQSPVKRVIADTYQSVSGTGAAAVEELKVQSEQLTGDSSLTYKDLNPSAYPHPIAFNALPHIEPFLDNGYTNEEMKMVNETRKILHSPDIAVSATCVRVPVMLSHSEALHIEFEDHISPSDVSDILDGFPGIKVVDDPHANVYPMPIEAAGRDEVFVGRIRQDVSHPNGIAMWVVTDNLRKGAATNALQIAEEVMRRNLLPRQSVVSG